MAEKSSINKDFLNQVSVNKIAYKDVSKLSANADSAISNLQQGNFDLSVKLMLDMLSDSRINAVIQSRISNIFSDNLELKISDKSDEVHRENLLKAVNDAELKLFWISYLLLGVGIIKIDWRLESSPDGKDYYIPYLKNFLPLGLRYDNLSQSYFLLVQEIPESDTEKRINEIKDLSNVTTIQQAKDQSAKFEYLKDSYDWLILSNGNQGHLFGLINALKDDYVTAESTRNDLVLFNSDNNGRILLLKTPSDAEPAARDAFAQSLTSIKKNSTVVLPQGNSEYSSFGLDSIDSSGSKVYESYLETLNLCYNNYAILILGGNLTSSVSSVIVTGKHGCRRS